MLALPHPGHVGLALIAVGLLIGAGVGFSPLLVLGLDVLSYAELVFVLWATSLPFDYDLDTTARRVITSLLVFAAELAPLLLAQALTGARRAPVSHPPSG